MSNRQVLQESQLRNQHNNEKYTSQPGCTYPPPPGKCGQRKFQQLTSQVKDNDRQQQTGHEHNYYSISLIGCCPASLNVPYHKSCSSTDPVASHRDQLWAGLVIAGLAALVAGAELLKMAAKKTAILLRLVGAVMGAS
jgi:hypothetical protein